MKAVKRLSWGLPVAAMAVGAFALSSGAFGAMSGPSLPTPIAASAVTQEAAPAGIDGETWQEMATKRAGVPLIRVNGRLVANYKGSERGF
jgi:hypothetical protein